MYTVLVNMHKQFNLTVRRAEQETFAGDWLQMLSLVGSENVAEKRFKYLCLKSPWQQLQENFRLWQYFQLQHANTPNAQAGTCVSIFITMQDKSASGVMLQQSAACNNSQHLTALI
jgi:hypothetical protein